MGQRLVIRFNFKDETSDEALYSLSTYFHWSGYTDSTIKILNDVAEECANYKNKGFTNVQAVVKALYSIGAGFVEGEDMDNYNKLVDGKIVKFKTGSSRSNGMLSFDKDEFFWHEQLVIVNVNKEGEMEIEHFDAYCALDPRDLLYYDGMEQECIYDHVFLEECINQYENMSMTKDQLFEIFKSFMNEDCEWNFVNCSDKLPSQATVLNSCLPLVEKNGDDVYIFNEVSTIFDTECTFIFHEPEDYDGLQIYHKLA